MKIFISGLISLAVLTFFVNIQAQVVPNEDYRSILEDYFEADGPGATVIVTKGGKVLYRDAIGYADLELAVPMKPEHIFRIGSITKQFTAVAILMLEEEDKLNVSDDITKYLTEYPTHGHIVTIEHLLTHTSGIPSYTGIPGFMQDEIRTDRTLDELIDVFKDLPFDFAPGEEWRYNNSGYVLLGAVIEVTSGMDYATFIEERIFAKLGMENSMYGSNTEVIKGRVPGYTPNGDELNRASYLSMSLPHAAGSLLSTVDDLNTWTQAIHENKLISEESRQRAFTEYLLNDGSGTDYGYGWVISGFEGSTSFEHGGGINGFLTNGIYVPEEELYVAVLSNCNCNPPNEASLKMAAAALGMEQLNADIPITKKEAEDYIGVYDIEGSDDLRTITFQDGHLYSQRTNGGLTEVHRYGTDKFHYPSSMTTLIFKRDNSGEIIGQTVTPRSGEGGYALRISKEVEEKETVKVKRSLLEKYVGTYELMPNFDIVMTINNGNLNGQATGQGGFDLEARSDTVFEYPPAGIRVEFAAPEADGTVHEFTLFQGGQELVAKRK